MLINRIKNSQNNRPNFGWNITTHSQLTKAAVKHIPELTPYAKLLSIGSQLADIRIKYTSNLGQHSHEYIGRGALEYDLVPQNAFDMFHDNLSKLDLLVRADRKIKSMYKAGITLHFLQDMAVPIHTKEECLGVMKLGKHILYEAQARHKQDFIKGLTSRPEKINFYDYFIETSEKSRKMKNPFEIKDKNLNEKSIEEALRNAYDTTFNFLWKFNEIVHNPDKKERILDDFFSSKFIKSLLR